MKRYFSLTLLAVALIVPSAVFAQTQTGPATASIGPCVSLTQHLEKGSLDSRTGGQVTILQNFLKGQGYLNSSATTGTYGSMTVSAVKAFQDAVGLSTPGAVGPMTRAMIKKISCIKATPDLGLHNPTTSSTPGNCTPKWSCGWGPCVGGSQGMRPIDSNNCGVTTGSSGIACPALAQVCKPSTQPSITVISPNGGENYSPTSLVTVKYKSANISGKTLTMYLYSPIVGNSTNITATASESGSIDLYLSKISSLTSGQYKITMCAESISDSVSGKTLCDSSDNYFTIATSGVSPIKVISPTLENSYTTGNTISIKWASVSSLVKTTSGVSTIELVSFYGGYSVGLYGTKYGDYYPNTSGAFSYKIPNTIPSDTYYVKLTPSDRSLPVISQTFQIKQSQQPQSQPTVSVVGTPRLALNYNSNLVEGQLTATENVKITAGSNSMKIFSGMAWFQFLDSSGSADRLNNSTVSISVANGGYLVSGVDMYSRPYFVLPANTSATFKVVRSVYPQQMFAGAYTATLKNLYYDDPNQTGSSINLDIPANKSNSVTIVGEKSPYITSVTSSVKAGDTMTIIGARLDVTSTLLIDGVIDRSVVYSGLSGGAKVVFTVPSTWTAGQHYLEFSNSYGKSNRVGFTVLSLSRPSLTIFSPIVGKTFLQGQANLISWQSVGPNAKYLLGYTASLPEGKGVIAALDAYQASCGSSDKCFYYWTPNFANPNVTISIYDSVSGQSAVSAAIDIVSSSAQPSITITSTNQTTSLTPTISGTARGLSQLGIVLSNTSGKVYGSGLISVVNGSWSVTVSPALTVGQYTLDVYDSNNNPLERDGFNVLPSSQPSITVLSPNGGETLTQGQTYNLKWTASNLTNVNLYILKNRLMMPTVASNIPASNGSYNWTVPTSLSGTGFQFRVAAVGAMPDDSDGTFNIVASASNPRVPSCLNGSGPLLPGQTYCNSSLIQANHNVLTASAFNTSVSQSNNVSSVGTTGGSSTEQNPSQCLALANNLQYGGNDTYTAGEVSKLQSFLQVQGFLTANSTGYFGDQTFTAVKSFQAGNNVEATGFVGALTRAKIQEVSCQ